MTGIEECFRRGLLRRVEPSATKSAESLRRAGEWLDEAEKNVAAEAYRSALASTYLAFFHAARTVLFRDGVREKSHYCVGIYLEKYVEQNVLEEKWVMLFDRMRSARHTDQYSFHIPPSSEEVESAMKAAESFIERIARLMRETAKNG